MIQYHIDLRQQQCDYDDRCCILCWLQSAMILNDHCEDISFESNDTSFDSRKKLGQQDLYLTFTWPLFYPCFKAFFIFLLPLFDSRERLRQQDLYADRDSAGDKALVMKQFLSDEKVDF